MIRIREIGRLADARPAKLRRRNAVKANPAGGGFDSVYLKVFPKSGLLRIFRQRFGAQFIRENGIGRIAGIAERRFKSDCSVVAHAGDPLPIDGGAALAEKSPLVNIRHGFNRRHRCNDLENRAGRVQAGEQTVEVDALIFRRDLRAKGRRIVRVVVRGGNHAENLTGFVIINAYGALAPGQRAICGGAEVGIER